MASFYNTFLLRGTNTPKLHIPRSMVRLYNEIEKKQRMK